MLRDKHRWKARKKNEDAIIVKGSPGAHFILTFCTVLDGPRVSDALQ